MQNFHTWSVFNFVICAFAFVYSQQAYACRKKKKQGVFVSFGHRNKKCIEVATVEFLKGRLVLLLEIERPLSISHVFSKQSVFYFIKLSALFFSPLMLYFIFNPSLLFLPVFAGEISLCHVFLFLTVFWPLHGEQCCTFFIIHISMAMVLIGDFTAYL